RGRRWLLGGRSVAGARAAPPRAHPSTRQWSWIGSASGVSVVEVACEPVAEWRAGLADGERDAAQVVGAGRAVRGGGLGERVEGVGLDEGPGRGHGGAGLVGV